MENKIELVVEKEKMDSTDVLVAELQATIDAQFRTDHMTLPAAPAPHNPKRDEDSDIERQAILNPNLAMDAVVDGQGTTRQELTDRLYLGKLPNAGKEDGPKHTVTVEIGENGEKTIVVKAPDEVHASTEPKIAIAPKEGLINHTTPFGTAPINDELILEESPKFQIPKEPTK